MTSYHNVYLHDDGSQHVSMYPHIDRKSADRANWYMANTKRRRIAVIRVKYKQ